MQQLHINVSPELNQPLATWLRHMVKTTRRHKSLYKALDIYIGEQSVGPRMRGPEVELNRVLEVALTMADRLEGRPV